MKQSLEKILIKLFLLCYISVFLSSCQEDTLLESPNSEVQNKSEENLIAPEHTNLYLELGQEKTIAYSVDNMQSAVDFINAYKENSDYISRTIEPTHFYVRILPSTEEHLIILENITSNEENEVFIGNYPLHYEIVEEGSFIYRDDEDEVKYQALYSTLPIDFSFEEFVPYEIIEPVYKPTEEETDLEITALVLANDYHDLEIEIEDEPLGPENLAEFINLENEEIEIKSNRFKPYGKFAVWDTDKGQFVAVSNTKISVGRGIWWHYVHTDYYGTFVANKFYRGKVRIRAKWKSQTATIRKHWNEIIGIGVSDHLMTLTNNNNGRHYNTSISDNHKWYKATVHNAVVKYTNYMKTKGVLTYQFNTANIWVMEGNKFNGSTLMMNRYTWAVSYNAILADWLPWLSPISFPITTVLNVLFGHLYPDITFTFNEKNTKKIDQLVFHESGHYSHALQAGGSYWGTLVNRELDNILSCGGDPYCDGTQPSVWSGQFIALAEGWATFTEYKTMAGYYTTDKNGNNIVDYMESFNMYTTPMTIISPEDNKSWFLTGLFWDILDDSTETNTYLRNGQNNQVIRRIIDNVQFGHLSSDFSPLFNKLTNDTYTGFEFKNKLKAYNPGYETQIDELFYSYGYGW